MSDAWEMLAPLRSGLTPVPATASSVCRFCHGACPPGYRQCLPCFRADTGIGAVEILPVSLSIDTGLLHRHLRGYKDDSNAQVRLRMSLRLSALLTVFMQHHAACVGEFDSWSPCLPSGGPPSSR